MILGSCVQCLGSCISLCHRFHYLSVFSPAFRLSLKSHSGTAGRQSSLVIHGADFSTKDMDNDNCMCKCALMLTGGKRQESHSCDYVYIICEQNESYKSQSNICIAFAASFQLLTLYLSLH